MPPLLMRCSSLLVVCALPVLAEPPLPQPAPDDHVAVALHTWHRGERNSGFGPFLGAGVATALAGSLLLGNAGDSKLMKNAAWPLIGFGTLEVLAGLFFGFSSFSKEAERADLLQADRPTLVTAERERLARITGRFQPILLAVEGAVTVAGGVMAGAGAARKDDALIGLGLGLAVQGLVLFLLDWAVLDRAQAYESALR